MSWPKPVFFVVLRWPTSTMFPCSVELFCFRLCWALFSSLLSSCFPCWEFFFSVERGFCCAEYFSTLPSVFLLCGVVFFSVLHFASLRSSSLLDREETVLGREKRPTRQKRKTHDGEEKLLGREENCWPEKKNYSAEKKSAQQRRLTAWQNRGVHIRGVLYLWVAVLGLLLCVIGDSWDSAHKFYSKV